MTGRQASSRRSSHTHIILDTFIVWLFVLQPPPAPPFDIYSGDCLRMDLNWCVGGRWKVRWMDVWLKQYRSTLIAIFNDVLLFCEVALHKELSSHSIQLMLQLNTSKNNNDELVGCAEWFRKQVEITTNRIKIHSRTSNNLSVLLTNFLVRLSWEFLIDLGLLSK